MIWLLMACNDQNSESFEITDPAREVAETVEAECDATPLLSFAEMYLDPECDGYKAWSVIYGEFSEEVPPIITCASSRPFFAWIGPDMRDLEPGNLSWDLNVAAAPEGDITLDTLITVRLEAKHPSNLAETLITLPDSAFTLTIGDDMYQPAFAYAEDSGQEFGYQSLDITFVVEQIHIPAGECQTFTFSVDDTGVSYLIYDWVQILLPYAFTWTTPDIEGIAFAVDVERQSPFNERGTIYLVP